MNHPRGPRQWMGEPGWPVAWHVRHVEDTGSTNDDLLAAADDGAPDRAVLLADHQAAGRGRLDRRWDAPPGANLLVSLLLREVPEHPSELTRRIGLAAARAAHEMASIDAALKWPNDVVVEDRKLAGILAQRARDGSVVVGLGMNVRWSPDGAAHLGADQDPAAVLRAVLEAFDALPADIDALYRRSLSTLGRRVRIDMPDGSALLATATDVEPDGRLVVLDECAVTHRIDVGDIVHLRPAT